MATVTQTEVLTWLGQNETPGDDWEDWNDLWETVGLNDTDPPDPPSPPLPTRLAKQLAWSEIIANEFDGTVPGGWPN